MKATIGLDRCLTFINTQLQPAAGVPAYRDGQRRRAITISRQSGSGGHAVAARLVELLRAQDPGGERPWTVFDRNLVEKVIEDHHLPGRLARFMPEDRISEISDMMDELFGLHPSSWTLVHQTAETILHLAELGNVILIGRGANLITRKLDYVFHVRLIGSEEKRVAYIQKLEQVSYREAQAMVRREDRGRSRYLKKYFHEDIHNPLLYHQIINTDLVAYDDAAAMIASAVCPPIPVPAGAF